MEVLLDVYPYHKLVRLTNSPNLMNIRALDEGCVPMVNKMHSNGIAIDISRLDAITCDLMKLEDEYKRQIYEYVPRDKLESFTQAVANEDVDEPISPISPKIEPTSLEDTEFNLNSGDQLATLLFTHLGIGALPGQRLKMTKSQSRLATDKKQLEILARGEGAHPALKLILKYREAFKLRTTYTEKFPKIARYDPVTDTFRIYTTFTVTRTSTGRLASKNPNLMNISFRTDLGRSIREAFIPSPGKVFIGADFSQVELRILAHCSRDPNMLDIYSNNGDIHVSTAMRAFNRTLEEVTSKEGKFKYRLPSKTVNFALAYGITNLGLQQQLAMQGLAWSEDECQEFIDLWFSLYPGVQELLETYYYRARRYGAVWDLFGRIRLIPEVRSQHSWIRRAGLRQAGNAPIQSCSQAFTKLAMGYIEEENESLRLLGYGVEPLLQIHDEILMEVDMDIADYVAERMTWLMSNLTTLNHLDMRVPILADAQIMPDCWKKAA